ncbi:unnamed protein product, partial [Staurois parvus]
MDGLIAEVATYHGTTLYFTELLRATHSLTNVCRSILYAYSILQKPVAMEVTETPESNDLEG